MKKMLIFLAIALYSHCLAQTISGNIYNTKDSLPIPFVNIYLVQHQTGTNTDFNGFFELELRTNDSAVVSCMGYETLNILFSAISDNPEIYLTPENSLLEEVNVVGDSEKPSHKIMRNVVKNKRKHNPRKIEFLKYDKYTTNLFSIYGLSENFEQKKLIKKIGVIDQFVHSNDSVKILPILFQETYSRVHQQKNQFQEKVISHNSTGVEFIDVSALTQNKNNDIDIYNNNLLKVFAVQFPISGKLITTILY